MHIQCFLFSIFKLGPQNSRSLKYWANEEPGFYDWPILQYKDIAKNLTKGQFAQNLKNGSDIYQHVQIEEEEEGKLNSIQCDTCAAWFYYKCENITTKTNTSEWDCSKCLSSVINQF